MAGFHHPNRAPLDPPLPPIDASRDYFTPSLHLCFTPAATTTRLHPSDTAYLEDLARKLAAFGLLKPAATATGSTSFTAQLEGLRPEARLSQFRSAANLEERRPVGSGRLSQTQSGVPIHGRSSSLGLPCYSDGYGNNGLRQGYNPIMNLRKSPHSPSPSPSEVERYERVALMQQQQQRRRALLAQSRMVSSRDRVVSVSRRACSGTGVFLPRVVNNNDNFMQGFDGGKKTRGLEEAPAVVQPSATSSELMANQEMSCQAPPEPNLPAEWTY